MYTRSLVTMFAAIILTASFSTAGEYYISPNGNNSTGNGSATKPWASITKAIASVPDDGSTIIAKDGLYVGAQSFARNFSIPCKVVAENPYKAQFSSPKDGNRVLYITNASNIVLDGLEFFGSGSTKNDYLVQITTERSHSLTFQNCIFHDSYKNDLLKINDSANYITFTGCVFFNQNNNPGDEHFDINGVNNIIIESSIFFNDYPGSGRPDENKSHSFIVIKNSGSTPDKTKNITLRKNIFMNWSGLGDQAFILLGEDGKPFYEAINVLVENNLFLHNSKVKIWSTLLYKGGLRDITTRANTISGHPGIRGFGTYSAILLNVGQNPKIKDIDFSNNLFCDNTGQNTRFSSTNATTFVPNTLTFTNNLYWNKGKKFNSEKTDMFTPELDAKAIVADPTLPDVLENIVLPRFDQKTNRFISGNKTIREEFERIVNLYAVPGKNSAAIGKADKSKMPAEDILDNPRSSTPDIGCYETQK